LEPPHLRFFLGHSFAIRIACAFLYFSLFATVKGKLSCWRKWGKKGQKKICVLYTTKRKIERYINIKNEMKIKKETFHVSS
jgi:hypothetical protein